MQYLISFLEGVITFISPCLLPMLPVYVSYFAGGGQRSTRRTLTNALGFVLGFTHRLFHPVLLYTQPIQAHKANHQCVQSTGTSDINKQKSLRFYPHP